MKNILFTSNKVHTTARIGVLFFSLCFSPLINAGNAEKPMNGIESSETTQQNKIKITGVVTDSKGESIIGANVVVKGQSNVGAITDVEGRYQIMVPSDNAILQVSYLGYVTEEIKVKGRRNINVMLNEDSKALDEVVVVGYGQQKKESVVVSMSSIKPKDIVVPSRSLNNSLAGQVAGLIAVQRSGEPGYDNAEFWIRGVSTFAGGTSPLVLVDGVPRSMSDIEPDEIETFSVLKDAAATAIYGAEGANGVVLVTTKRGRVEKAKISFKTEHTISSPTRLPEFVGSADYLDLFNEALHNDGELPQFSDDLIAHYRNNDDPDLYPNTNWIDKMLRKNTFTHRYTLNVRGGTEKAKYFVSAAYYNESGIFKGSPTKQYNTNIGIDRINLRSNIDMNVSSTTTVGVDLALQYLVNNYPGTGTANIFPDVFTDPVSGKSYLYWGNGFMAVAELSGDRLNIVPGSQRVITPSDGTFREGTCVIFRKGKYYFLWSEDDTRSENYRVRYGIADSPVGPIQIPESNLILAKDPEKGIYGTGHNSVIQVPGKDEWYIVYHRFKRPEGITMGEAAGYHREVCIDRMYFGKDGTILPVTPTLEGIRPVKVRNKSVYEK